MKSTNLKLSILAILTLAVTSCRQTDEEYVSVTEPSEVTMKREVEKSSPYSDTITVENQNDNLLLEEDPKNPPRK